MIKIAKKIITVGLIGAFVIGSKGVFASALPVKAETKPQNAQQIFLKAQKTSLHGIMVKLGWISKDEKKGSPKLFGFLKLKDKEKNAYLDIYVSQGRITTEEKMQVLNQIEEMGANLKETGVFKRPQKRPVMSRILGLHPGLDKMEVQKRLRGFHELSKAEKKQSVFRAKQKNLIDRAETAYLISWIDSL